MGAENRNLFRDGPACHLCSTDFATPFVREGEMDSKKSPRAGLGVLGNGYDLDRTGLGMIPGLFTRRMPVKIDGKMGLSVPGPTSTGNIALE